MRTRLRPIGVRQAGAFLAIIAIAGVVAVLTVMAVSELGIDQPPAAAVEEPLTLTIDAPATCEATRGRGWGNDEAVYDDEGNYVRTERKLVGWYEFKEFEVVWEVRGGKGPYELTIDGAVEDVNGPYQGADGRGLVVCAQKTVESFIDRDAGVYSTDLRALRADPEIDSGMKTLKVMVTDARGDTAHATTEVYVILRDPHTLTRGQTYRVWGHIFTAPATHDLEFLGSNDVNCEDVPDDQRCEEEWVRFGITDGGTIARLILYASDLTEVERWQVLPDGTAITGRMVDLLGTQTEVGDDTIDQAFDAFLDSRDQGPRLSGTRQ